MDNGPTTEGLVEACIRDHNWAGARALIEDHKVWQLAEIERLERMVDRAMENPPKRRPTFRSLREMEYYLFWGS